MDFWKVNEKGADATSNMDVCRKQRAGIEFLSHGGIKQFEIVEIFKKCI